MSQTLQIMRMGEQIAELIADRTQLEEQIELAKELLKEFIAICDFGTEDDYNLRCRAEQFIKENEK